MNVESKELIKDVYLGIFLEKENMRYMHCAKNLYYLKVIKNMARI